MTNFTVSEGSGTAHEELETNPDIKIGDTIQYISNNQQGYKKYKVVLGDEGEKSLKLIDSDDHQMGMYDDDSDNDDDNDDDDDATDCLRDIAGYADVLRAGRPGRPNCVW